MYGQGESKCKFRLDKYGHGLFDFRENYKCELTLSSLDSIMWE